SLTDGTKVTVDLGHKAVAAENELGKRVYFINAPNARVISQSEEHLVLDMGADHGFKIGDVLYGLPKHICPTVALYERAVIIKDHHLAGEWKIRSRDRKINI
ncbi:MAG: D-TA family PLP-dependent enzyme, partial [Sphingobacteriales bacterium]